MAAVDTGGGIRVVAAGGGSRWQGHNTRRNSLPLHPLSLSHFGVGGGEDGATAAACRWWWQVMVADGGGRLSSVLSAGNVSDSHV